MSTPESSQTPLGELPSEIRIDEIEKRLRNGDDPKPVVERLVNDFLR